MAPSFKKASRTETKVRMGLAGPSGSGKTMSALKIARGLVGDARAFAVIDTEHGRASLYAGIDGVGSFDVLELAAPFSPARYIEAIKAACDAGYPAIVIDSGSHEWVGEGGVLDIVDAAAKRMRGNSYAGWKEGTPAHQSFLDAIIQASAHVLVTFRSKQEYLQQDDGGRKTIQKVGLAPITRDGAEYELDMMGEIDLAHDLVFTKTRCSLLDGRRFNKPGAEVSAILRSWLGGAEAAVARAKVEAVIDESAARVLGAVIVEELKATPAGADLVKAGRALVEESKSVATEDATDPVAALLTRIANADGLPALQVLFADVASAGPVAKAAWSTRRAEILAARKTESAGA